MTKAPDGHIRVWPTNDAIRNAVRHPISGAFKAGDDPTFWLNDQFTFRRIEDGDVLTKPVEAVEARIAHQPSAESRVAVAQPTEQAPPRPDKPKR